MQVTYQSFPKRQGLICLRRRSRPRLVRSRTLWKYPKAPVVPKVRQRAEQLADRAPVWGRTECCENHNDGAGENPYDGQQNEPPDEPDYELPEATENQVEDQFENRFKHSCCLIVSISATSQTGHYKWPSALESRDTCANSKFLTETM